MEGNIQGRDVVSWCWKIIKRRLSPDAALFEDGDLYCKLSSKYIPEELLKDFEFPRIKEFPCGVANCTHTFHSVSKYESHYNSCHRNVCQTCHRVLPTAHLLELHVLEVHDTMFSLLVEKQEMYQCLLENCPRKFRDTAARRDHMVKIHKYPINYRYDRSRHKSTPKWKAYNRKNGDTISMETQPSPEIQPTSNMSSVSMETESTGNAKSANTMSSARVFSHKVPKNICFGHGASRGFLGGRGRGRGKHPNKTHWHNKDKGSTDTAVDIENVDMSDLSQALS